MHLHHRLEAPASPYVVQAGTIIPVVLVTGIHSDLPEVITARVREPVYDSVAGEHLLIPQGTRLLGVYDSKIVHGQNRVLIAWQRLLLPDGGSIQLDGMPGVDLAGFAGVKDKVNYHVARLFGAVVLSSILSVGARLPAASISTGDGVSPAQEFAVDASRNFNRTGQEIVGRELRVQPTLQIRPGFSMNVMVHEDMVLRPYRGP